VVAPLNIGLLFFLAMSSLGVYSVALGGWASNNKYSLLGGLRAASQMLAYEVFMGLSLLGVVLLAGTFDLRGIVEAQRGLWYCIPQFFGFVVFLIAGVAETRRLPFDIPEAESELVAGYHSEYSSMKFGMFFVGEYLGITLISAMIVTLFFGGWLGPVLPPVVWFILKTFVFVAFFILLRASLPRPRSDQLLAWGWKLLLPVALLNLVVTGAVLLGPLHGSGGHGKHVSHSPSRPPTGLATGGDCPQPQVAQPDRAAENSPPVYRCQARVKSRTGRPEDIETGKLKTGKWDSVHFPVFNLPVFSAFGCGSAALSFGSAVITKGCGRLDGKEEGYA
jgi:hypothetical protein